MKYIRILSLLIVGILVVIIGCSDDPSLLGIGLISPQDTIGLQQIEIKADSTRTVISRISGSLSTLVGKYHDPTTSTTTAAKALLQFEGFTNIPDSAIIDTAYITINLNYKYKEMNGFIRFYIHEMDSSWSEATYKWDSLTSASYNPVYDAIFEQTVTADDTVMTIHIESLVQRWVADSINKPKGIILIPDLNASDLIVGTRYASSTEYRRLLTVAYHTIGDTIKTYSTKSIQNTFIADGEIPTSSNLVYIQGGIGYRVLMRFDSLPLPKLVSITKATLELVANGTDPSMNIYGHDSLIVYLSRKNAPPYDSLVLGTICAPDTSGSKKVYRADIRAMVQQWNIREPNNGLVIKSYSEYTSFNRFGFYGSSAVDSLRPKLSITYTKLP